MDRPALAAVAMNAPRRHCAAYFANVADHQPHPWFVAHEPFWCGGTMPSVVWPDKCPRCGWSRRGEDVDMRTAAQPVEWCTHEYHA